MNANNVTSIFYFSVDPSNYGALKETMKGWLVSAKKVCDLYQQLERNCNREIMKLEDRLQMNFKDLELKEKYEQQKEGYRQQLPSWKEASENYGNKFEIFMNNWSDCALIDSWIIGEGENFNSPGYIYYEFCDENRSVEGVAALSSVYKQGPDGTKFLQLRYLVTHTKNYVLSVEGAHSKIFGSVSIIPNALSVSLSKVEEIAKAMKLGGIYIVDCANNTDLQFYKDHGYRSSMDDTKTIVLLKMFQ
jgi:hypothetical protein